MICNCWLQKRLCFISPSPMPVALCVLVHPRSRPTSFSINAGAQFNIRSVRSIRPNICGHFIFRNCVRNAVSKPPSVNRGKVLCIPFRLFSAPLKCPQNSIVKFVQHIGAVIVEHYSTKIRHGFHLHKFYKIMKIMLDFFIAV